MEEQVPNAAAIFEKIPSIDLKEVVSPMFLVDGVRWLLKIGAMRLSLVEDKEPLDLIEDEVSDRKVEETIRKLRTKHPMALLSLKKYITSISKKLQWQCLPLIQWRNY